MTVKMTASLWFFMLDATCFFVTANSLENISDNGWRPMSSEKVAELRNFIKRPLNARIPEYPYIFQGKVETPVNKNRPSVDYEILSHWSREDISRKFEEIKEPTKVIFDQMPQPIQDTLVILNTSKPQQIIRGAKKIDDDILTRQVNSIHQDNKLINNDLTKIVLPENTYEVTENVDENNEKDIDQKESNTGYIYEIKETTTKDQNNLTKNLFSILANYNIRTSDELPNYAISLRQNSRNSNNDYIYMKVPVKIPLKYNSPNHIPIDPLLAVFLSNYGHYIPGMYGFQRNYNNLYGYLASNNIHNNKPFGPYKLFSDTNSYH